MRLLGSLLVTIVAPALLQGQRLHPSAPIADIRYEVTADSAAVGRRHLGVAMTFRVASTAPV
ncbi:MAG: hypothetical protein ACJ79K_04795, partial [Gemmatimonadaceae bacterium]